MSHLKTTCFLFLLFITLHTNAQSEADFNKKMIADICADLNKKDIPVNKENFEMQLGLILMPHIVKNAAEVKKHWGLDYTIDGEGEKIGRRIGEMLVTGCPAFAEMMLQFAAQEESKSVSGTLLRIASQQFTYLVVKSANGKEEKIWWLEFFEGSDKLQSASAKLLNKPITVSFKEVEFYDALNKEYKTYKVATGIK